MRRALKLGIGLLVLAAAAAHLLYWYGPRERTGAPEPGSLAARLLGSGEYGACLWVPFPHQNLGALAGSIGDGSRFVAAAARTAELPSPELPSFGPFAVPPSRDIVACSDLGGGRLFVAARVYPGLAAVARLAGRLAGNPWLEGGQVRETRGRRAEVEERVLHVAWREGLWTVRSGPAPALEEPAADPPLALPPNLGVLHLERDVSDFPVGDYILQRNGDDLEVTLAGGGPVAEPPVAAGDDAPVLLAAAGPAWPAESPRPLPPAAMALFEVEGGLDLGPLGKLPGAAVLNPPGSRRWTLPARGLAGILARNLPRGNAAGWSIVALDAASLARAKALAPEIARLVPPGGDAPDGRLVLGIWLRPRPALSLVTRLRKSLEKVPLVERRQVQSWRDWETLLEPLAGCRRVSMAATRSPSAFLLRLQGCGG
jgi:hypothetical protein